MLRLLRDKATQRYLCPDGSWSLEWREARIFGDVTTLVDVALHSERTHLEEVLLMGEGPSEYDVCLPLKAPPQSAPPEEREGR